MWPQGRNGGKRCGCDNVREARYVVTEIKNHADFASLETSGSHRAASFPLVARGARYERRGARGLAKNNVLVAFGSMDLESVVKVNGSSA